MTSAGAGPNSMTSAGAGAGAGSPKSMTSAGATSETICRTSVTAGGAIATPAPKGAGRRSDRRLKMNQRFMKESRLIASVMANRSPPASAVAQVSANICVEAGRPSVVISSAVSSSSPHSASRACKYGQLTRYSVTTSPAAMLSTSTARPTPAADGGTEAPIPEP